MKHTVWIVAGWFLIGACGLAHVEVARLAEQLGSGDEQAMIEARQMLAYEAPDEVAAAVAPLLAHESESVWRAAWNVLRDAGSEAAMPGREARRTAVTNTLTALLAPGHPKDVKRRVLRLLPAIVPDHYNVHAIARLLDDPELREQARTVLTDIGSIRARTALQQGLPGADPEFRAALVDGLTALGDPAALTALLRYQQDRAPEVRAAVARAIGRFGSREHAEILREYQRAEDSTLRAEGIHGELMLLGRIGQQGGHWPWVMSRYRALLKSDDYLAQSGAIVGLGTFGDETAVDLILDTVVREGHEALEDPAMEAFRHLMGRAPQARLAQRFDGLPPVLQQRLAHFFGESGAEAYAPALLAAARSEHTAVRRAAVEALAASGLPEAPALLAEALESDDAETARAGRRGLEQAARRAEERDDTTAAGNAWLTLYHHAEDDDQRDTALEGVKRNPVPAAADVLLAHIDGDSLGDLPVQTGIELIRSLKAEERHEEAERLFDASLARLAHPGNTQPFIDFLHADGLAEKWYDRLGFVRDFRIAGPFDWDTADGFEANPVDAPDVDLDAEYETRTGTRGWEAVRAEGLPALFDFIGHYEQQDNATAYVRAVVVVEEETEATVRIGSDDGFKLWVNGEAAGEHLVDRGSAPDQDSAPATLQAGENTLLLQVTQGGGGWNFMVRLTGPDGRPLAFTQP